MNFKDITTWSVSKGIAKPQKPVQHPGFPFDRSRQQWSDFEKEAQQHTYATDAPDGSYSADRFEKAIFQSRPNPILLWTDHDPELYESFSDFESQFEDYQTRQFLPFIDQVKEAESPKFGEWISVKDRLPENRNWCLVMCNKELFLSNYKHGIFETEKPLILHGVTHWMPLPSPPKTL